MNERIKELALDAGLLNYVDNETPRRYFIDGNADLEEVQKFAELIVKDCVKIAIEQGDMAEYSFTPKRASLFRLGAMKAATMIKRTFGVENES